MPIRREDRRAFAAAEPASERYRHVRFSSAVDFPSPKTVGTRPAATGTACRRANVRLLRLQPLGPDARRFVQWLLAHANIDLDCYRMEPLARRLAACLRVLRTRSVPEAFERLRRQPELVPKALSTLLIGVTEFFREREVFSYLDQRVLPRLSSRGDGLRVWSVGCADGAELYSVAMLLAGRGLLEGSTLLGTDCRAEAIDQARRGWFEAARLQSLDERLRQAHFVPRHRGWQVEDSLRRVMRWQQGNVFAGPPAGRSSWDLILCRNLAIYLEPAAAIRLWAVLTGSLRVGGVLVVGKAERPERGFPLVRLVRCVFQKTEGCQ